MCHLPKITIQSVTCLTTSKHQAELIDMKTFTAPTGRVGCLLSRVWTSPIPYQAFAPRSHTKLSFPKRISPPERCHWGLWHTSGGLKMFLTDWPLHLFPEVTLVTVLSVFLREYWQNAHMTFPAVMAKSCIVVCLY